MNKEIKADLEKLIGEMNIKPFIKKFQKRYEDFFGLSVKEEEPKMESVKKLLEGKTIATAEFSSYAADDTLTLTFTDSTNIKIVADPNNTFDGLAFFVKKTKTVEQEYDEEIK